MNLLTPEYLNESNLRVVLEKVIEDHHKKAVTKGWLSHFVKGLTRRGRTLFWVLFLKKYRDDATLWYQSSKGNMKMIMESLFCHRVITPNVIRLEPDQDFYQVKSRHLDWLFHEVIPVEFA